ncbi:MAG: M14 family zinc carboxypeptidase [Planctomycetota bacterium]
MRPPRRNTFIAPASALFVLLSGAAAGAGAQPDQTIDVLSHTLPKHYAGQVVARVRADSMREVAAATALAESLWSEGAGTARPFDIQIHADRLGALTEAGLEYEIAIADLQAHAEARWRMVQDCERFERARPVRPDQRGASPHDESWFGNYKQLSQIRSYVAGLAAARPDIATLTDIGDSLQGNDIEAITITGPDQPDNPASDRPVIIWNGCQHAREWISPMTVTYLASRLIADYDTDAEVRDLVDSVRFVIVPMVNPDGYLYTWSNERFWRKNRRNNLDGTSGVDLNRNWGYEWGGEGSSGSTNSDTYRGPSPFSEPETQTIRDLALGFGDDLAAHIDYHSYSQLILWPFGYDFNVTTPEPDRTFFATLTQDLSDEILSFSGQFYDPIQSWLLYPAAGVATDWFYGQTGAKSITFELRPSDQIAGGLDGFDPSPGEILPCARENFEAAKLFASRTTQALSFSAAAPQTAPANQPVPVSFTVSAGIEDYDTGSVQIFASVAGDTFAPLPTVPNGPGVFEAEVPALACGQTAQLFIQATTLGGAAVTFPSGDPLSIDAIDVSFRDNMESDTGWIVGASGDTATTGVWERADPEGTAAQPEDDRSADGSLCWITGASSGGGLGGNDIDGGATTLTSPQLDATDGSGDAVLSYARWYSNDLGNAPDSDSMLVQISGDDGGTWATLETVTENANAWVERRFVVGDFVTPTDAVRIRFIASDLGDGSIVEAGVDDLQIEFTGCDSVLTADLAEPFGVFNFFDIAAYIALYNAGDPAADFDGNGTLNFFDISAFVGLFNEGV